MKLLDRWKRYLAYAQAWEAHHKAQRWEMEVWIPGDPLNPLRVAVMVVVLVALLVMGYNLVG